MYDPRSRELGLSHVAGERAQGHDFELWVIEGQNAPRSLGVIPVGASMRMPVAQDLQTMIGSGATFAISMEPAGGSPSGTPTGPVVAAGSLRPI
jgi:anti-sigma-K factor RskA